MEITAPKIIIISGPSGVGKNAVVEKLLAQNSSLQEVITWTTRAPRPGEIAGTHYYFVSEAEFKNNIQTNNFLEYAQVYSYYYGTPISGINQIVAAGKIPLLIIDVQGALQIKKKLPAEKLVMIFILPESLEQLELQKKGRGTPLSVAENETRKINATQEIKHAAEYNYQIINYSGHLDQTVAQIQTILKK